MMSQPAFFQVTTTRSLKQGLEDRGFDRAYNGLVSIIPSHVLFTPFTGKADLFLTFTKAGFVRFVCFIRALMTGNAVFIFWALFIFG
jgi:hypothetical protein